MHDRAIWNNFERLYIDYQPRLIAYALRFVGDSVEAQDLVQDCFVRLWDDYAELEEDEAPMLLFTMMRHRCLNFLKHKRIVREYADRQISRIRPDRRGEERLYNLCFSYNEAEYPYLYQELEKRNIPAIIMEPLLGGRLSNVPQHIVTRLKQRRPEDSVASWAFRFAGSPELVLTALSGMTYMEHLQDNLRTFSPLDPCTEAEMALLEDTAQMMLAYPTIPCNDCKYCMPCPYGLDIPAILLHYNRCVNEGNVPKSSQDEHYREARRAFLIGYDRSVPKLRQASHCTGCDQCTPHCPQSINIPKKLREIDSFVEKLKQETL